VPVAVSGDDVPLAEQPAVAQLLTALRCVLRPDELGEDVAEQLLLGTIGRADALQLRRLRRELRASAPPMEPGAPEALLASAVLDSAGAQLLPSRVAGPVLRVARALEAGRAALAESSSPEDVLWAIWSATGLAARWDAASAGGGSAGAAADRDLDSVVGLFEAAARFTDRLPAASAADFYEHLAAQQVPGDTFSAQVARGEAVQVLTAHASKGLEWDLVCIAGAQEGTWPDLRRRGSLLGSELLVDVAAGRDGAGVETLAPQLAEERRLFYVAATRARRRLVVSAVSGDDEQPSRFLDELDPVDGERPYAEVPPGTHLADLVAELRSVVSDPSEAAADRQAAATQLARLAIAGVAGADPDDWWGLAEVSDPGPVANPDRPVPVSPSRIEAFLRCELQTLLGQLGARDSDEVGASLGTLIHDVAAIADPDAELPELEKLLDERWSTLDFGAAWLGANERARATTMLAKLVAWLTSTRATLTLAGRELPFDVEVGDARLRGRVDRLERDRDGGLIVIDYKTGKRKPKDDELPRHPQLAAYQVAVEAGGFDEPGQQPSASAGARLVQLGGAAAKVGEQAQPALAADEDPEWILREIGYVAARMRGGQFSATINSYCGNCDVQASCPIRPEGRTVTG
jgi:RecB family exonuclease